MQQDRLTVPAERLTAFLPDDLGSPLTVVCGRSEADLAAVVDELRRRHDQRFKVVDLSFSESTAGGDLLTNGTLPSLRDCHDPAAFTNLHRLPGAAVGALEALARQVAATGTRCVATVALPLPPHARPAFAAAFDRLRRDGLIRLVTLRPVPRGELPDLVVSMTGALPETALCDRLWSLTLGWPSAVATALRIGAITVVDRHAYLSSWPARIEPGDGLLACVRGLGLRVWSAAKAVAVLAPLGPAVPRLTGQVLGVPEQEAGALLGTLADAGVLLPVRKRTAWRFRLPLLQHALRSSLGPYERRRIAQIAVTALWQGTAECADPAFLADRLLDAGNLVDRERARAELLDHARRAAPDDTDRPLRWLRAAADLAPKPAERALTLLDHARACLAHGAARRALSSTDTVLHEHVDDLPDGRLVDVCLSHLAALFATGELDTLNRVADGTWWPWPGDEVQRAVGRAAALSSLGDWRSAQHVLADVRDHPDAHLVARHLRDLGPFNRLWLGDPDAFDAEVAALPARVAAGEPLSDQLRRDAEALVALGELRRAEPLLALTGHAPVRLACQATLAAAGGRADEALELVRKSLATEPHTGCGPGHGVMFHVAATLLLHKGKLVRALEMVNTARERVPALPHLLAVAEAAHHGLFGRQADAVTVLVQALDHAEATGVVALTDLLWISLADIAVSRGDQMSLSCYLERVAAVAKRMHTEQAEINRLVLHATVHADRGAAAEATALLRGRPSLELADGLERLVRFGVGAPELLSEAYEAAGTMDALLHRSVLRNLMRTHGIPVPGRQATVAENERLLAVLVTDGLGNKQIATLLDTSEKSVEGRLSRLFSRTGYRSRVELAAAMLTGRFTA
ncbi:regulatory LuxR family protein [Lentzea atacamensis]|uniref:Regulatory LuxR family protein n=1 Tax=Lentzea atacamensis TaxID=531938 RepID=A0ABX9EDF6_9PSEU|nr:LuxR C-terminal-related transcriptional regulator [Lentzea atacamensis]RAS66958.1 regulatory LuxR family protein [Lentzea atacamensis]